MKHLLILYILLLSFWCHSVQAQKLSISENEYTGERAIGYYKVISKDKYLVDTNSYSYVRDDGGYHTIRHKGYLQEQRFTYDSKDNIRVKHGLWRLEDSSGRIMEQSYWHDGIELWTKYYDSNMVLETYDYKSADTSYRVDYLNDVIFLKTAYFRKNGKRSYLMAYYPELPLYISNAELPFYLNYYKKKGDTINVKVASNRSITIDSIISSDAVFIVCNRQRHPYTLRGGDTLALTIAYVPNHDTMIRTGNVTLFAEGEAYVLKAMGKAYHIDQETFELKQITVSKSKDKVLRVKYDEFGTVTFFMYDKDGNDVRFKTGNDMNTTNFDHTTTVDFSIYLDNLPAGKYTFGYANCNFGGEVQLIIQE